MAYMRRRSYGKPPPRRHPPVASGQTDWRGEPICERCGSTWLAAVHNVPEISDEQREHEARRVGER